MVGGGNLSRRPGTLSGDGKLLLCPCGQEVHIFSAVTGERVGALTGHTGDVTSVILDPNDEEQVYTSSNDCSVRRWAYRMGECLGTVQAEVPVKHMVLHRDEGVAYFSTQHREGGGRVMLYSTQTGKFSGTAMKTRGPGPLALCHSAGGAGLQPGGGGGGGGLAACVDRNSLFVWRTGADFCQPLNLHHTKPYTCLAIAADGSAIAGGDATGRILIWRGFEPAVPSARREGAHSGKAGLPASNTPPLTTLHWHASAVGALCFSPDGTYLLSGGGEGVLVIWSLEGSAAKPTFLPRLGGPIVGLHPSPVDPARYVVRQADNVVRIVNVATMKVETSVLGLRPPPAGMAPPAGVGGGGAALVAAGGLRGAGGGGGGGTLVLPCEHAQLQFYDVERDRHMMLLQVAPRNALSQTESPSARGGPLTAPPPPPPPFVSLLSFSSDGAVMATVELRPDAGPYGSTEACLKFWDSRAAALALDAPADDASAPGPGPGSAASNAPPFSVNTRVDEPHRDLVSALAYHPSRHVAVTCGGAGAEAEFKVWVQERRPAAPAAAQSGGKARPGGGSSGTLWRCRSVGGYKGLGLGAAAFSPDGSVLAVAAEARVTLWDAESNALAAVLPAAPGARGATAPLTQLAFVPGTPFLAAASPACLAVYNLLTAAVHWSLPYGAVSISADASYGLLAAALRAPRPAAPPPAAGPAAAGGQAGRPAQQAAPPPPSCHVLVLDPRDGAPRYHCHVPGAAYVHLAHVQQGSVGAAAGEGGEGCSPLLIVRDNRTYSMAALPGALEEEAQQQQPAALARQQEVSAFEAAFGRPTGRAEAMELEPVAGAAAAGIDAVGGRPRWADLFDAPSHVLPPPTALASAFLTLLTTADA